MSIMGFDTYVAHINAPIKDRMIPNTKMTGHKLSKLCLTSFTFSVGAYVINKAGSLSMPSIVFVIIDVVFSKLKSFK